MDQFLWLEDSNSEDVKGWVAKQNAVTTEELESNPIFSKFLSKMALKNDTRLIPTFTRDRDFYFTELDENKNWVLKRGSGNREVEDVFNLGEWKLVGAMRSSLNPDLYLLDLANDNYDQTTVKEFSFALNDFVKDGFSLPLGCNVCCYYKEDYLVFGDPKGKLSSSGYPLVLKLLKRGMPYESAELIFTGDDKDAAIFLCCFRDQKMVAITRYIVSGKQFEISVLNDEGEINKIEIPSSFYTCCFMNEFLIVSNTEDVVVEGRDYPARSFLSVNMVSGKIECIREGNDLGTPRDPFALKDSLILHMVEDIQAKYFRYYYSNGWEMEAIELPGEGTVVKSSVSNDLKSFIYTYQDYLTPLTFFHCDENLKSTILYQTPHDFDSSDLIFERKYALSKDGVKLPVSIIRNKNLEFNGQNKTILSAYGGYGLTITPMFPTPLTQEWLERDGVYVIAHIRGGGEFGPKWVAAGKEKFILNSVNDFIATAEFLIEAKITSPEHLSISGGSHGGFLVGAAMSLRPDLYHRVCCSVPLLDVKRAEEMGGAGAALKAYYVDPETGDIPISPYHEVKEGIKYPEIFLFTSTTDQRCHPAHARKMAAKLEEHGNSVYFLEKSSGGHNCALSMEDQNYNLAMMLSFFLQ